MDSPEYKRLLRYFFLKKISKRSFDSHLRMVLKPEEMALHNQKMIGVYVNAVNAPPVRADTSSASNINIGDAASTTDTQVQEKSELPVSKSSSTSATSKSTGSTLVSKNNPLPTVNSKSKRSSSAGLPQVSNESKMVGQMMMSKPLQPFVPNFNKRTHSNNPNNNISGLEKKAKEKNENLTSCVSPQDGNSSLNQNQVPPAFVSAANSTATSPVVLTPTSSSSNFGLKSEVNSSFSESTVTPVHSNPNTVVSSSVTSPNILSNSAGTAASRIPGDPTNPVVVPSSAKLPPAGLNNNNLNHVLKNSIKVGGKVSVKNGGKVKKSPMRGRKASGPDGIAAPPYPSVNPNKVLKGKNR